MPDATPPGLPWISIALYGVAATNLVLAAVVAHAARSKANVSKRAAAGAKSVLKEENLVFAFVLLAVALWALSNALFRQADTLSLATFWARFSYLPALLTAASFFHFSRVYPRRSLLSGSYISAVYLVALLVGALAFVPGLVVHEVVADGDGNRRLLTGSGLYLVAVYMVAASAAAFALFWRNQNRLRGIHQARARYVLFGSVLTSLVGLWFNLFLPLLGDYRFVWLGPIGSLFVVGFTAYSIVTQRLFDVRILIRRTFVYAVYLAAFAGAFAALGKGLEHVLSPLFGGEESYSTGLITALVVGFALDPLKRHLHKLASKRLFKGELVDDREASDD